MSEEGERLEVARIMVNHANVAQLHTGNIINWQMLKKAVVRKSSQELNDGLQSAVDAWLKTLDPMNINIDDPLNVIDITNKSLVHKVGRGKMHREKLKVSVKLFITQWRTEIIGQAISKVCSELGVKRVDALLVSFPFDMIQEEDMNNNVPNNEMEKVKIVWRELESFVHKGAITHLGVCDFDAVSLSELHSWAKVKPTIDQINMTNCCTAPDDLIEFSRENEIELLSHNDGIEILSPHSFQKLMSDSIQVENNNEWYPTFIARYSVIVRCRGIVESKGYIVSADRIAVPGNEDYKFF